MQELYEKKILAEISEQRARCHAQVKKTRVPCRDILIDFAVVDYYQKQEHLAVDMGKLRDTLGERSKIGATILVNGKWGDTSGWERWLRCHDIIPVLLPVQFTETGEMRQKSVDYVLQQLIIDTLGTKARELVLLSTDGEHLAVLLEYVRSLGIYTVVAYLLKPAKKLLAAADKVLDLTGKIVPRPHL